MRIQEQARPFLVCVHDVTPAFEQDIQRIIGDLGALVGRNFCAGVVPNWHAQWPIVVHSGFCAFLREQTTEILLHGYRHTRQSGSGLVSLLTERSDEMNGVSASDLRQFLQEGRHELAAATGSAIRGFLPPAWQRGFVNHQALSAAGLEYMLGYFRIESRVDACIPLSTFSWDCGRWRALGMAGHAFGVLQHATRRGVPSLAIHPRDVERGYWPLILRTVDRLLNAGYAPTTPGQLISTMESQRADAQVAV